MSQTATRGATRGAWPVERFEAPTQCAELLGPRPARTDRQVEEALLERERRG